MIVRKAVFAARKANEVDHFAATLFTRLLPDTLDFPGKGDIGKHCPMRQQRKVLQHHAKRVAANIKQPVTHTKNMPKGATLFQGQRFGPGYPAVP